MIYRVNRGISGDMLEDDLNEMARAGWVLETMTVEGSLYTLVYYNKEIMAWQTPPSTPSRVTA